MTIKKYIANFIPLERLLELVSYYNNKSFSKTKYNNSLLDNLNMNFKDKVSSPCFYFIGDLFYKDYQQGQLREYIVLDGYYRIIDIRQYKDKIINYNNTITKNNTNYIYRYDPIPYTGKRKNNCDSSPKLTSELKYAEYHKEFVRAKRNYKNLLREEKYRHIEKSWKHQSRNKFQWMKGVKWDYGNRNWKKISG